MKQAFSGRPETEDERQKRRRAKRFILGAGAGPAIKPDEDGKIRIHRLTPDASGRQENADDGDATGDARRPQT